MVLFEKALGIGKRGEAGVEYRKVYFRIRSRYQFDSGWPAETDAAKFHEESRSLFQSAGWDLQPGGDSTSDTVTKGWQELYCILTKSFEEFIGLKNSAYVDINNCPFAPQLLNRGFAKDTGLYKESGFCSYPLWTFDETVLKETGGEKYERYARAYDEYMESSFIGMMGAEDETGEEICTGMMM